MKSSIKNTMFFVMIVIIFPSLSQGDIVYFKDGRQVKTGGAWIENGQVKCYRFGQIVGYPQEQVEKIEKEEKQSAQKPIEKEEKQSAQKPNENTVVYSGDDVKDGFRDLHWEDHISKIEGMTYISTDPSFGGVKNYIRKTDELRIGGAELETIFYGFWQDKLMCVTITFKNFNNYHCLLEAAIKRFGEPYRPNQFIERYGWYRHDPQTSRSIEFSEISNEGTMYMMSKHLTEEAGAYNNKRAEEGASKDF